MGGYPYNGTLERNLVYFAKYLPANAHQVVPPEPEQDYLLGSRFADYGLAFAFALLIPVIRAILTRFIYQPTGEAMMLRHLKKRDEAQSAEKMRKWKESCWKLTVYLTFSVLAFLVSHTERWFTDPTYFWRGCTQYPPCNLYVSKGILLFYCIQTGFYIQAIHYLAFIEVRRRDFLESLVHHVVTVLLLVYSYYVNFTRVGIMIMLLHDISDIFLEGAKLSRYRKNEPAAMTSFVLFFVSWVLLRVIYFPVVIIRSTLIDPIQLIARPYDIDPQWHYLAFNSMLLVLFVLHLYWSYLILITLLGTLKGKTRDVREDSDDDE